MREERGVRTGEREREVTDRERKLIMSSGKVSESEVWI